MADDRVDGTRPTTASRPRSSPASTRWPRPASTRSGASGPAASCPPSTTWSSSPPPSPATRWRATGSAARRATVLGARHGAKPIELEIPITIAGMSFGALSATAKEALGRAATAVGTSTTTGDGGMTPEERKASALLVYQVLPSRYGFDPADLRQADAVEIVDRPGGQAGRRGHAARAEGQRPGGRHAHPARRHRPALGQPPPGLGRPRRPAHQDRGAARGHGLGHPDLRQGRRHPGRPRREAGGGRRRRRGGGRRHAGRHRRHPGRVHRARRHPDPAGGPHGRRGARGDRHARRGAAGRLGRHPLRGRRGQGAGPRAPTPSPSAWPPCCPGLQPAVLPRRRRRSRSTSSADYAALGTSPGHCAHCHTGRCPVGITTQDADARGPARSRPGRRPRWPTTCGRIDHGGHRPGPGLRQVRRAPPRARGSGRAHRRGGGHGQGAAGRHQLDPRLAHAERRDRTPHRPTWSSSGPAWPAEHGPRPGRARGVSDVLVLERATVGSGGTGKSSGIVRCHYGIPSLAAMAWRALPVLETRPRSWAPTRATTTPATWSGWATRTSVRCGPTSPCSSARIEVELVGHDDGARAVAGRRSRRLRRVRLRAARRLRRRPPDGAGLRRGRPPGRGPAAPALRGGRARAARRTGSRGVRLADGERIGAGQVVLAAGPWSVALAAGVGIDLPVRAQRAQILLVDPGRPLEPVPVFSDLVSLQYVRSEGRRPSWWATATTPSPSGPTPTTTASGSTTTSWPRRSRSSTTASPASTAPRSSSSYAGCYDVTPDYNPVISAVPVDGLWLCAGFSGHGYKISPSVGELMADLIVAGASRHPDIDHRDFRWERFAEDDPPGQPPPLRRRRADALTRCSPWPTGVPERGIY